MIRRFALLAATLALLVAQPAVAGPVLLVSLDGLRPVDAHDNPVMPNLRALQNQGAWANGVTGVWPSLTYPSHVTLVTGAAPARHGIGGNEAFDPLDGNAGGWMFYARDITVDTLWHALRRSGLKSAALNWPVTVGAPIDFNLPQFWRVRTAEDAKLDAVLATPGLRQRLAAATGVEFPLGSDGSCEADEDRARQAAALIALERPDFTALHLECLDHLEHDFGPDSTEARAGLARLDAMLGTLVAAARKSLPELTVVIVSDHGFAPVHSLVNLGRVFREDGLAGTAEWRASPWAMSGSAAVILRDPDDLDARLKTRRLLDRLAANRKLGIARIIEQPEIVRLGGSSRAAFWIAFKPGFAAGGYADGSLVQHAEIRGTHGYPPDAPTMNSMLIAAGPTIGARGALGQIDMRAIAPAVAKQLGISLTGAEMPAAF